MTSSDATPSRPSNASEAPVPAWRRLQRAARETFAVFQVTPRVLRLVWRAHPPSAAALLALNTVQGLQPLAEVWLAKLILDAISAAVLGSGDPWVAAPYVLGLVGVRAGIAVAGNAIWSAINFLLQHLGDFLTRDVNALILGKTNSLRDISFLEGPRFYDTLLKAQNEAGHRPLNIISSLVWMVRATLTLVSMAAVLFAFQPVLALIIVLVNLPNIYFRFRQGKEQWVINNWSVPEVRMMNYFRRLLTDKVDAKEIRLFGLGDYFLGEHARTFDAFHRRYSLMRRRHWGWNSALAALAGLGMAGAYGYIVLQVATGASTLGDLLLYTGALTSAQQNLATLTWQVSSFYQGNLFVRNLFEFLDMPPSMPEPPPGTKPPVPAPLQQGIELRGVAFAYAGSNRNVLEDVTLVIRPGQTVALVGENGAGKTTLVKLLTRLYDPTAGQIFVDGMDLRAYDLESWRHQIAVVFQDFTRFNLPARENIGLGRFEHAEDLMRVQAAAGRGGADTVISRLPDGYDTMLGRRFSGIGHDGVDLSGGEWQKIALSRAFMRAGDVPLSPSPSPLEGNDGSGGAQLLILDEPTAALDARAEHELFLRFNDLTRDKTTLLISHRFSTVRMADHIAVLEDGRITEQGSHQELMARGATYARLYRMQADRYR